MHVNQLRSRSKTCTKPQGMYSRCLGGRTVNGCWLVSDRSRVQTDIVSAYLSLVEPVIYFGTPVNLAGWSSREPILLENFPGL